MTDPVDERKAAAQVVRATRGRWLGGVCAGLPSVRGVGTVGLRVLFVLASLLGGIGVVVYLACWLIIPAADATDGPERNRGVVMFAWAAGGLGVAALLAALSAAATVFGFGWIVFALAGLVLLGALTGSPRRSVACLVPLAALTLPAIAVALGNVRLSLQSGASIAKPASARILGKTTYRSGFGTMLIDLRHTRLPASGTVPLTVDAGLRRTIVALPSGQCVHVSVKYDINTFTSRLAALVSARASLPMSAVVMFGRVYGASGTNHPRGSASNTGTRPGPTLAINFDSQGGGLFVRDYPASVNPDLDPNWPGFIVHVEPPPILRDEPKKLRPIIERAWRSRRAAELASRRRLDALMPGPCG